MVIKEATPAVLRSLERGAPLACFSFSSSIKSVSLLGPSDWNWTREYWTLIGWQRLREIEPSPNVHLVVFRYSMSFWALSLYWKRLTIRSNVPMSSGNSNPILRRLGVEGVGASGHFNYHSQILRLLSSAVQLVIFRLFFLWGGDMKLRFLFLYFLSWNIPWKIRRRLEIVGFSPLLFTAHKGILLQVFR